MDAGGTGLLTYAGTCSSMGWTVPFPSPERLQWEGPGGHSRLSGWRDVRVHSCGAVAEFHRASRTFRCGQGLKVKQPSQIPSRKSSASLKL